MSCVTVVCQTWLLPLHNKSLNSHLTCFSSQCSAGRALGPAGVQQNHRFWVTHHRAEKCICSDRVTVEEGTMEVPQLPVWGPKLSVAAPEPSESLCGTALQQHLCYGCAPLGNPMPLSLTTFTAVHLQHLAGELLLCSAPPCTPHCMCCCNPQVSSACAHY